MPDESAPAPRAEPPEPREFTDSRGTTWIVREIATPSIPPKLLKFLGGDRRRGGWLVFESTQGEKRRLSPYPADWGTIPSAGLEQWCAQATRVPPGPARREVDQDPSSSSTR